MARVARQDFVGVHLLRRLLTSADLAVRMVRPERGNLTVRRIGTIGFGLYGSAWYMTARTENPDDGALANDRMIGWSERQNSLPAAQWLERILRGKAPALLTTTLAAQVEAAAAGLGLAILPHFLGREAGLRQLPLELGLDQPTWLVIHTDLSASQRIRAVADHLVETIRGSEDRLMGTPPESRD